LIHRFLPSPGPATIFPGKTAALILSLCFCGIVSLTICDYGITWDEAVYFHAGQSYFSWLKEPSLENIEPVFSVKLSNTPLVNVYDLKEFRIKK
jgi:hypothetical protein